MSTLAEAILDVLDRTRDRVGNRLSSFGWYAVARKDVQDTIRSRRFLVLSLIFITLFALPPALTTYTSFGSEASPSEVAVLLKVMFLWAASILVPLVAIVVGYTAITGERESGTLKLLLSQPNTRRDVVLGKVIGRSLAIAVPILLGFLAVLLVMWPSDLSLKLFEFAAFALLTAALGVVFTGLAVGISAGIGTNFRAMAASVGLFVYLSFFWNSAVNSLTSLLADHVGIGDSARGNLVMTLKLLNPTQAYKSLVESLYAPVLPARMSIVGPPDQNEHWVHICYKALDGGLGITGQETIRCAGNSVPFYYSDAIVAIYFLLWLVVPVALGYYAFRDADL